MSKPDLKVIQHPSGLTPNNVRIIDFGWGKVTIEYPDEERITSGTAVYCLEMAKLEIMGK